MFHDPNYKESEDFLDLDISDEELEEVAFDSVVPATCIHGCDVEPDGACPHGMPSILIHVGLMCLMLMVGCGGDIEPSVATEPIPMISTTEEKATPVAQEGLGDWIDHYFAYSSGGYEATKHRIMSKARQVWMIFQDKGLSWLETVGNPLKDPLIEDQSLTFDEYLSIIEAHMPEANG